jgi:uncharacterized spore protein YtfJ
MRIRVSSAGVMVAPRPRAVANKGGTLNQSIDELVKGYRDAITVKKVFGEPFQKNGITVIPAAKVMGGGGGGSGESPDQGQGSGTGFGMTGKPVGAYVIRGEDVKWQPAIDLNRLITGGLVLTGFAIALGFLRSR